jgi:hypothetical protein
MNAPPKRLRSALELRHRPVAQLVEPRVATCLRTCTSPAATFESRPVSHAIARHARVRSLFLYLGNPHLLNVSARSMT